MHLLRRQVVQAVRGGMSQTDGACTFGASLREVSTLRRLDREGGLLTLKHRGRRQGEGRLSGKRAACIRPMIVGKVPDQLALPQTKSCPLRMVHSPVSKPFLKVRFLATGEPFFFSKLSHASQESS